MASDSVALDLAGGPGAVISSLVPLSEGSARTVLVLENLIRLDATGAGAEVIVRITNASAGPLRWAAAGGLADFVAPGDTFEVTIQRRSDLGRLQLIAGETVASTLTVAVCEGASGDHLLAQAIVGG